MRTPRNNLKLLWLIPAALLCIAAYYLFQKTQVRTDFDRELTIYFPGGDKENPTVNREAFRLALANYSKKVTSPTDPVHQLHWIWFQKRNDPSKREKFDGGVSTGPNLKIGNHVTQYVSFSSLQDLEAFAKATTCPMPPPPATPTPCPLDP